MRLPVFLRARILRACVRGVTAPDAGRHLAEFAHSSSAGCSFEATVGNVINKRRQWSTPDEAIGQTTDEPAIDVNDPQTMISLLKALVLRGSPARFDALFARVEALERRIATGKKGPP